MNSKRFNHRIQKELEGIFGNALYGITVYSKMEFPITIEATILGPSGSPYEGGLFHLKIVVTDEYPFAPPDVAFLTRIFHPNIDEQGRICLDILKPLPTGTWRCTNTIMNVLMAIQALLVTPNPYDPLCDDIAQLYLSNKELFEKTAREYTANYAQCELPPSFAHVKSKGDESKENKKNEDSTMSSAGPSSSSKGDEAKENKKNEDSAMSSAGPSSSPAMECSFEGEEDEKNNEFAPSSSDQKRPLFDVECMEFNEDEGERNNESGLSSSNPKRPLSDFAMDEDTQSKKL